MDPPVAVVEDPLEGRLLVVAGGAPAVCRVVRATGGLSYALDLIEGDYAEPTAPLWPSVVPGPFRMFGYAVVVRAGALRPVDLLKIHAGTTRIYGSVSFGYWLWSDAGLAPLTEPDLRRALASPWVQAWRGEARVRRGIALRE